MGSIRPRRAPFGPTNGPTALRRRHEGSGQLIQDRGAPSGGSYSKRISSATVRTFSSWEELGGLATRVDLGLRIMLRLRLVEARNDEAERARVVVADLLDRRAVEYHGVAADARHPWSVHRRELGRVIPDVRQGGGPLARRPAAQLDRHAVEAAAAGSIVARRADVRRRRLGPQAAAGAGSGLTGPGPDRLRRPGITRSNERLSGPVFNRRECLNVQPVLTETRASQRSSGAASVAGGCGAAPCRPSQQPADARTGAPRRLLCRERGPGRALLLVVRCGRELGVSEADGCIDPRRVCRPSARRPFVLGARVDTLKVGSRTATDTSVGRS